MPSPYGTSSSCRTRDSPRAHPGDTVLGPSTFRLAHLEPYAEASRTWLHDEAEVIDTSHLTPEQAAMQIVDAANG
jgi:hypothetical protein